MTTRQTAARIKVLETKAARLRSKLATGQGDPCDIQQALDAVGAEHSELSAIMAELLNDAEDAVFGECWTESEAAEVLGVSP